MKRLLLVVFLTLLLSAAVFAENSEHAIEWRMFGKNLNHTKWDGSSFPTSPRINNITFSTGATSMGSSSIANGFLYFSGDQILRQLNATNISHQINLYSDLIGSPEITNLYPIATTNYVYVTSRDPDGGVLDQLNATNVSRAIASYIPEVRVPTLSSPSSYGNYIIYQTGDLYRTNATNVSRNVSDPATNIQFTGSSTPAIANDYIYVGTSKGIYQINATNISRQVAFYNASSASHSSPAVYDGYVYSAIGNYTVQLNASNVSQLINRYFTGDDLPYSSPAIANGYLYIGTGRNNRTLQLNATNISLLVASYTMNNNVYAAPTIAEGSVYIGSYDNYMYQLNATNISQLIGLYRTGGGIFSAAAYANGYIYFESNDKKIYQILAGNISDQIPPSITINSPSSTTYSNADISLDVDSNENVNCNYSLSSTSRTIYTTSSLSTEITLLDQAPTIAYNLSVQCFDRAGNFGESQVSFSITSQSSSTDSSGSSSGSSSSGGGVTRNYIHVVGQGFPYTTLLGSRDKYEFTFEDEKHTLTLNSFNSTAAKVTLQSEPLNLVLTKGASQGVDLDNDGEIDYSVEYKGVRDSKAEISIDSTRSGVSLSSALEQMNAGKPSVSSNLLTSSSYIFFATTVLLAILAVYLYTRNKKLLRNLGYQ